MENSNRLIEEFNKTFPFGLQEQIGTGFNDCTPKVRAFLEKVRQETLKEVEEIKKEYIKEVLLDFHKNRLEGKGYDFFFKLSTDLDELKK